MKGIDRQTDRKKRRREGMDRGMKVKTKREREKLVTVPEWYFNG